MPWPEAELRGNEELISIRGNEELISILEAWRPVTLVVCLGELERVKVISSDPGYDGPEGAD